MSIEQKFYSPEEVAIILGVSKSFIYQQMQKSNISYVKFGKAARFTDEDIEEFVNREVHPMVTDNV